MLGTNLLQVRSQHNVPYCGNDEVTGLKKRSETELFQVRLTDGLAVF